jgi:nitrite reductase (NO-forming)
MKKSLLALGVIAAALSVTAPVHACEACNNLLARRLLGGASPSAHAAELTDLVRKSGWSGADNMLAFAAGGSLQFSAETGGSGGGPAGAVPPPHPFQAIIDRDQKLGMWQTSYVAPGTKADKRFTLEMRESDVFIGNGVVYSGFTVNGTIPGPTLIAEEGDVIEMTVVNRGDIQHGVSIHAAYTQTSKYFGKIPAGGTKTLLFRVNHPGVYMYHCAPGGHAIPMHTLLGQYGMLVVKPKTVKFKAEQIIGHPPDVELYIVQHELYASGKDAVEGHAAYVMFNGKLFRYVENPIKVRPGDFVRINFLNVGPNLVSTFHLVGIIWDYAYWQGTPAPENTLVGGQTVTAGPSDSWVVDFRVPPDEGNYLIVTHAFGSTTRGAIGVLAASKDAVRTPTVLADGPAFTEEEIAQHTAQAVRVISPFKPTTEELENPHALAPGQKKLRVQIIGNSFYPKVAVVPAGTTVEWTNEDIFAFASGEFAGIHDAVTSDAPEGAGFSSKLLGHAEKWSTVLTVKGEYKYYCTPHPYMEGVIRVE